MCMSVWLFMSVTVSVFVKVSEFGHWVVWGALACHNNIVHPGMDVKYLERT